MNEKVARHPMLNASPELATSIFGIAEKRDELKRSFKHPTPFSSPDLAMPHFLTGSHNTGAIAR
ncbi:hypothetical protein J5X98_16870 [Leptothermofonsia sichuanensis E412]|uniref:hypothetical protein n=1 Tax=Leptothermofonsia sichuanensis TaxID=2917832 RepID=UPI001CA6F663|nr:hypothetical protein [Leptothermofonsia sichuanensis]QZZ19084.1 hypothetical protein J5X98_16870 [Leptothermofonsia sichuanensis E412]